MDNVQLSKRNSILQSIKSILISKKTPQNAGAALGMVGSSPQLSGAADECLQIETTIESVRDFRKVAVLMLGK